MKYTPPIGQEAQGEDAHYIDGNPELGILGSPVPAAAIEQGQREIVEVIKQAGLDPSDADLTQLWQAIDRLTQRGAVATPTKPGIVKPDGLTIQVQEEGTLTAVDVKLGDKPGDTAIKRGMLGDTVLLDTTGVDLNTMLTPGVFRATKAAANSFKNAPALVAYHYDIWLSVTGVQTYGWIQQEISTMYSGHWRRWRDPEGVWGEWASICPYFPPGIILPLIPLLKSTPIYNVLECNGAAVSRTTYAALFDKLGTQYGEGDGKTTFTLPDLRFRTIQGFGAGAQLYYEAGLPNVTFTIPTEGIDHTVTGGPAHIYTGHKTRSFRLSEASHVYGKSATVQPPAASVYFYITF